MRLTHPDIAPAAAPMRFTFEGREVAALPGETIAAALSAAGILELRRTAGGAPRGLWCGMGACFDCVVTVDGRQGQRACLVKARDGMAVTAALPAVPAPAGAKPAAIADRACDLLVVGAGPAGLAAALAAAQAGLPRVLVLDERAEAGGQYLKPLAPSHRHRAPDRQFQAGDALRAAVAAAGVEVIPNATAWGAFAPDEIAALVGTAAVTIRPRRLLLAAGAHERPVPIPGWTLPGVMTTGALQTLARAQRVSPGASVVVAGNGPLNLQLACELLAGGVRVVAVAEAAPKPSAARWRDALALWRAAPDLARDGLGYLLHLRRAGVPVLWGATPLACEGEGRFAALRLATPRGERRIEAEACALNLGFQPETGLARAELRRARDFQAALWRVFAPPAFDVGAIADATVVCRCEEVTAGALRAAQAEGCGSLAALKKATRAGMGRCQGRMCGATVARLAGATEEAGFALPRAPVKPVPAAPLMLELPEQEAPWFNHAAPGFDAWRAKPAAPPPAACDVLVIGGGLVGLSTALHLAREGADVLVVERGEAGMAASTANAGSLHVQLLTYDFDGESETGPALDRLPLGPESIGLWGEIAREAGEGLGIRTEGGLMLAETEAELAWLRAKVAAERKHGIGAHLLGANELRSLAPWLGPEFIGAELCEGEGQIDPLRGTLAVKRLALRAGARLAEGVEVQAIARDGAGFAVTTAGGPIRAGRIVCAAGPFTARVAAMLGVEGLPVTGAVQQVIATEGSAPAMRHLVAHASRHLSLKQGDGGHMLIGGGWPGVLDARGAPRNLRRSIEGNLWVAGRVMPAIEGMQVIRAWNGLAPEVDRAPLLGGLPGVPGAWVAVTSNGYTLGPLAGRLTAEAVLGRGRIPAAFTAARFG
ncbi:FAD-dependent oxidoreductase [Paracraurococcus ruber]|uniref:FAD-dependent oxidoreductase n=1 Tax=Paracraurococcus ruber TaxID=77675 RepID=A0ABS1CWW1_9PROT|nr:FAD-dependent oxidoreductase [Paracraurococcus ruber]MBK1658442.1 hypothetical protein [Paracraurococcus ruber]